MPQTSASDIRFFWGKASSKSDASERSSAIMHPLLAHVLDVAAVAILLPGNARCGLDRRQIGMLVALHDIGKLCPGFQAKVPECWPTPALGPMPATPFPPLFHDVAGLTLLETLLDSALAPLFGTDEHGDEWLVAEKIELLRAVAGHHGKPVETNSSTRITPDTLKHAADFVSQLFDVFRPPPLPVIPLEAVRQIEWCLAALTLQADWIGSRQSWFPYVPPDAVADPSGYFWNNAIPQAQRALAQAGLAPAAIAPFRGLRTLATHIETLSPLQSLIETLTLPTGPVLLIIEDMTGSGKTEAALAAAHRLMAAGQADGLFMALPTMATANAMYDRLASAYQRLFHPAARPSLALAHGRARLDDRFVAAIAPEDDADRPNESEDTAEAHCAAWLGKETRRSLMAQVGIGTIDQAFLAVLPVKFATMRQAGLLGKVLVVDECHAFDPYMRAEMAALLHFHAAMGGSAILLSATLTQSLRQDLTNAFRAGLGQKRGPALSSTQYPLVTTASAVGVEELPCPPRAGLERTVSVRRLNDTDTARTAMHDAAASGAAACWIRNTVGDVIDAAESLREQGVKPIVFHARFAMIDRLAIERDVLARFGKNSTAEQRSAVLIASQVVEQSLDLDFDVLCTDIAPMDLILQRAGRLRRHQRTERRVDRAELLVVSPEPVAEPGALWIRSALPGTAAVYADPALLWRTARALFTRGELRVPEDIRTLIEDVGNTEATPTGLEKESLAANGKAQADGQQGRRNVLHFDHGYSAANGLWDAESRTPTRLEDDRRVTVRLAFVRDGIVTPWAMRYDAPAHPTDLQKAWALSEISVRQAILVHCPPPPGLETTMATARTGWSRWEREDTDSVLLLIVQESEGVWHGKGLRKDGTDVTILYDCVYGLRVTPPARG